MSPPEIPGLPSRFRLVESLGRGGQGHTWLAVEEEAVDEEADGEPRELALKVFRLGPDANWKAFDLFERECRVLRAIDHPRIPGYLGHGGSEDDGTFWLAMERIDGSSLEDALRDGRRFTDTRLRAVLLQLLDILHYLHELNPPVIHRDIKPANIIVDEEGEAWLVDFGGVREALMDRQHSTVIGTFGYMAPEQIRGQAGPASDLYALGATVAAIAAGTDASELPQAGLDIDLERCIKPGRIRDTLAVMLRADPRDRAQTAAEVQRHLEHGSLHALVHAPSGVPAPAPPRAVAHTSGRGRRRMVLGSLVTAGLLMAFGAPWAFVILMAGVSFLFFSGLAQFAAGVKRGLEDDD